MSLSGCGGGRLVDRHLAMERDERRDAEHGGEQIPHISCYQVLPGGQTMSDPIWHGTFARGRICHVTFDRFGRERYGPLPDHAGNEPQ